MAIKYIDEHIEDPMWNKAMELARSAYLVTQKLPEEGSYSLAAQIRRSAISIPTNLAKKWTTSDIDLIDRFRRDAKMSLYDLEIQLRLCVDLNYLPSEEASLLLDTINRLQRSFRAFT